MSQQQEPQQESQPQPQPVAERAKPRRRTSGASHHTALSPKEELQVLELYDEGRTATQIVAITGVSFTSIENVIKRSIRRFMAEQDALVSSIVNKKLRVLNYTISELTSAWRRSIGAAPATKKTRKKITDPEGGVTNEVTTTKEESPCHGDVSYLVELRHQLAEMSKLVGADAPARSESKASANHSVVVSRGPDVGSMTDDELRALIAVGEEIQALRNQPPQPIADTRGLGDASEGGDGPA